MLGSDDELTGRRPLARYSSFRKSMHTVRTNAQRRFTTNVPPHMNQSQSYSVLYAPFAFLKKFSRFQFCVFEPDRGLMSEFVDAENPWVPPTDRHLSLKAQLASGWSVRSKQPISDKKENEVTEQEQDLIKEVLARAAKSSEREEDRVVNYGMGDQRIESARSPSQSIAYREPQPRLLTVPDPSDYLRGGNDRRRSAPISAGTDRDELSAFPRPRSVGGQMWNPPHFNDSAYGAASPRDYPAFSPLSDATNEFPSHLQPPLRPPRRCSDVCVRETDANHRPERPAECFRLEGDSVRNLSHSTNCLHEQNVVSRRFFHRGSAFQGLLEPEKRDRSQSWTSACEWKASVSPSSNRRLVERLENMQRRAVESVSDDSHCSLCGASFGFWGHRGIAARCFDCDLYACQKHCGVETVTSTGQVVFLCKLCSEKRELWKKSGAWFYRGLPKYAIAEPGRKRQPKTTPDGPSPSSPRRLLPSPPIHAQTSRPNPRQPRWSDDRWNKGRLNSRKDSYTSSEDERQLAKKTIISCRNNRYESDSEEEEVAPADTDSPLSSPSHRSSEVPSPTVLSTKQQPPRLGPVVSQCSEQAACTDTSDTRSIDSGLARSERSQTASVEIQQPGGSSGPQSKGTSDNSLAQPPVRQSRSYSPLDEVLELQDAKPDSPMQQLASRTSSSLTVKQRDSKSRSDSPEELLSSSPDEDGSSLGTLEFSVLYDESTQTLRVKIVRAQKLRAMDSNGLSDPYVKLHMIPGAIKSTKLRTKTIPKTLNPEWNEELTYHGISEEDMLKKTLRLTVYDEDKIGSDFLGETRVVLKRISSGHERHFNVYLDKQLPVEQTEEALAERGKILLSLHFVPSKQQLIVGIVRCAELMGMDSSGYSDPYVKIHLKPEKKLKFKTPVKKQTCNPEFGLEYAMNMSPGDVDKRELEIAVFDKDIGKHDDFIGGIVLSSQSRGECLRHWNDVMKNAGRKVERWHKLQQIGSLA